jgi:hypothetical protein
MSEYSAPLSAGALTFAPDGTLCALSRARHEIYLW